MQVPQPENFTNHFLWIALPVILSLGAGQLAAFLANRRRGEQRDKKIAQELLQKDNRLAMLLEEYRLHEHNEKDGPLSAENIRYPRRQSDKDES